MCSVRDCHCNVDVTPGQVKRVASKDVDDRKGYGKMEGGVRTPYS